MADGLNQASGFLLKEVNRLALVEGVRRVAAGGSMLDPRLMHTVLERLPHGRPDIAPMGVSRRSTRWTGASSGATSANGCPTCCWTSLEAARELRCIRCRIRATCVACATWGRRVHRAGD